MKILSTHDLQAIMQRAENALRLREQSNKKIAEKSCGLTIGTDTCKSLFVEEPAALLLPAISLPNISKRHWNSTILSIKWKLSPPDVSAFVKKDL